MSKISLLLFLFFCAVTASSAQTKWALSSQSDGAKIYTGIVPGSKIKAIKAECLFKAKMSQLVAILLDIDNSPEWLYHTKVCRVINKVSAQDLYYYSIINLSSPAENRDFVCHLTVSQDPKTKVVTVSGMGVAGMVPSVNDIVRVNNSASLWTITPDPNGLLKVVYTLQVNPEGNLPSWLMDTFISEGPVQTVKNLRDELDKPDYKKVVLPFIQN